MWDKFATKLEQGIDRLIPTRKTGSREGFTWINQEIHCLMRKQDKLKNIGLGSADLMTKVNSWFISI